MTDWINFKEIRAKVSLEDVIVRLYGITTLDRRNEHELVGPCPVHHGDSATAFHADVAAGRWYCFSRKHGGNQIDFVAQREGIEIRQAFLVVKQFFLDGQPVQIKGPNGPLVVAPLGTTGTTIVAPMPTTPASTPAAPAPAEPPPAAAPPPKDHEAVNPPLSLELTLLHDHPHLIDDRKFQRATMEEFNIGYCARGTLRGMIAIPIHNEDGQLVAFAGRRLKPQAVRDDGKYKFPAKFHPDRLLYNYHRAKGLMAEAGLVLVKGFFSVARLYEAGITNAVAPMGFALSPFQRELLAKAPEVTVLFDGTDAGTAAATAVRDQLAGRTIVRIGRLPAGLEPDELSPRALRWLIHGLRQLDLAEASLTLRTPPTS